MCKKGRRGPLGFEPQISLSSQRLTAEAIRNSALLPLSYRPDFQVSRVCVLFTYRNQYKWLHRLVCKKVNRDPLGFEPQITPPSVAHQPAHKSRKRCAFTVKLRDPIKSFHTVIDTDKLPPKSNRVVP
jgi:hypothetical protein